MPPLQADLADLLSRLTPRLEGRPGAARASSATRRPRARRPRRVRHRRQSRPARPDAPKVSTAPVKRTRLLSVEAAQLAETLTGRLQKNYLEPGSGPMAPRPSIPRSGVRPWRRPTHSASPPRWRGAAVALPRRPRLDGRAGRSWEARLPGTGQGPADAAGAAMGLHEVVPNSGLRRSALAVWLTLSRDLGAARQRCAHLAPGLRHRRPAPRSWPGSPGPWPARSSSRR